MSDASVQTVRESAWSALSDRVAHYMGIDHSKGRLADLAARITAAAPGLGFASPDECVDSLLTTPWSPARIQQLARCLSVRETYFYREQASLRALQEQVLPTLLAQRRTEGRRLRVWTAGCCTGEESYSLAILLRQMLPDIEEWDIQIRATDIDEQALQRARKGEYAPWSFRGFPDELKAGYFTAAGGGRERIARSLRSLVRFEFHNLADPLAFVRHRAHYDLILCRNVLLYFAPTTVRVVLDGLAGSLAGDGWLAVGAVELALVDRPALVAVAFDECVLHRLAARRSEDGGRAHAARPPPQERQSPAVSALPDRALALRDGASVRRPGRRAHRQVTAPADRLAMRADPYGPLADAPAGSGIRAVAELLIEARACADAGRWSAARACCQRGLGLAPGSASLHETLAVALHELGEPAAAIAQLRQALSLEPGRWCAHYWLGQWLGQVGRKRSADRHLRRALNLIEQGPECALRPEAGGLSPALVGASIRATLAAQIP